MVSPLHQYLRSVIEIIASTYGRVHQRRHLGMLLIPWLLPSVGIIWMASSARAEQVIIVDARSAEAIPHFVGQS
ncbi:hypothetical protein D3C85_1042950 [compost metagenome]